VRSSFGVRVDAKWIRRYHPAPDASAELVCFPHVGGSATYFRPVSAALAGRTDVLAVQYPGRQDRYSEPPIDGLDVLADQIADVLAEDNGRPRSFFGLSRGALVAYETARTLERRGIEVETLFVSGRRAPSTRRDEALHLADDAAILRELSALNGTGAKLLDDPEIMRMVISLMREDFRAVETYAYVPGPLLRCPIVAMVGDLDPKVTVAEARAWSEHSAAGFELHLFSGGHFFLQDHWPAVLELMAPTVRT
jgi:surfactin synthase thioesterase subunit